MVGLGSCRPTIFAVSSAVPVGVEDDAGAGRLGVAIVLVLRGLRFGCESVMRGLQIGVGWGAGRGRSVMERKTTGECAEGE